jgi:hypothetical protein
MHVKRNGWLALLIVVAALGLYLGPALRNSSDATAGSEPGVAGEVAESPAVAAFRARRSDVLLEISGRVQRLLTDDRRGTRHQRFIVEVDDSLTVLVAHNIDLAERAPVAVGDSVHVRGEYVWNERGGLIHWTHRDTDGSHPAGWVRHRGRLYQ